jgi:hypothetical protein
VHRRAIYDQIRAASTAAAADSAALTGIVRRLRSPKASAGEDQP